MSLPLEGKHARRMEGIGGDALAKLIMKATRDLLSRAARRRPIVIVLEDLHWADASTIQFVEYLFKLVEKDSVLVINAFRPEEEGWEAFEGGSESLRGPILGDRRAAPR